MCLPGHRPIHNGGREMIEPGHPPADRYFDARPAPFLIRGASCTTSGTTVGFSYAVVTSDTRVLATSRRADIRAGRAPWATHVATNWSSRSRSAPRRISVSSVGPTPTRISDSSGCSMRHECRISSRAALLALYAATPARGRPTS